MWVKILIGGCWLAAAMVLVPVVQAQILISEIYPNPLSGESEWVELYNDATQSANLSGWTLEDVLASPKTIFTFGQLELTPGEWTVATVSAQLNNTQDGVTLKNQLGEVVGQMNYGSTTAGLSWSLAAEGYQLLAPTPGQVNQLPASPTPSPLASPSPSPAISPTPVPTPTPIPSPTPAPPLFEDRLALSRVSACPTSGQEWLEWQNLSDQELVGEITLKDAQNNSFVLGLSLPPQSRQTTDLSRHVLNNSGDEVFVYEQQQLLFRQVIPACPAPGTIYVWQNEQLITQVQPDPDDETEGQVLGSQSSSNSLPAAAVTSSQSPPRSTFIYPPSVLENLHFFAPATAAASVSAASSDQSPLFSSPPIAPFPNYGLIGGGFLWSALGIIELYERRSGKNQTLD